MDEQECVFLTHSPYHTLLAYSIASNRERDCHLFTQPYMPRDNFRDFFKIIEETDVFSSCYMLNTLYKEIGVFESGIKMNWHRVKNINKLTTFIREHEITEVCGVLGDRDITQAAMQCAVNTSDNTVCSIIEDGGAAYIEDTLSWIPYTFPRLHKILYYILFRYNYETISFDGEHRVDYYGDLEYISKIYATNPEYLSSNYNGYSKEQVQPDSVISLANTAPVDNYFSKHGFENGHDADINAVLLVPPGCKDEQMRTLLHRAVQTAVSDGSTIGIKFHPREKRSHLIEFDYDDVVEIPRQMPVELFVLYYRETIDVVIGNLSTGLTSIKWLCEDMSVVSMSELSIEAGITDYADEDIQQLLRNVGVLFPSSVSEIKEL